VVSLNTLHTGDTGSIVRITKGEPAYRAKLLSMGITPGTKFTIVRYAPLGDPIELEVRGYRLSLRRHESEIVMVEVDR